MVQQSFLGISAPEQTGLLSAGFPKQTKFEVSSEQLLLAVVIFQLCFANHSFWHRLSDAMGSFSSTPLSYISLFMMMLALMSLLYGLITPRQVIKPVLYFFLIRAAINSYFMDNYGVVIDRHALQSVFESDARESMEWLSVAMLWPVLWTGILPATLIHLFVRVRPRSLKRGILTRTVFLIACAAIALAAIALSYQSFASIARNHPALRDLINPFNVVNAVRGYVRKALPVESSLLRRIGADAVRGNSWSATAEKPTLFVLVVGESTRAASFGLLGYPRDTTPELAKLPLVLFQQVSSCGTNTATSVPCMFSNLGRANYDEHAANSQENLLDIVQRAGFSVEWIDNNTGSKNVARRVIETSVATDNDATLCNADGCHDEILVRELTKRLDAIQVSQERHGKQVDTLLVLHQLGSHGPAYFQRYPKQFTRFTPICKSVELHKCTQEELVNSYDNSVLYTDFVLAKLIGMLEQRKQINTALLFVSDHGESTGESGYFLHGAPYAIAPKEQTQIPMFFWFSAGFKAQRALQETCMATQRMVPASHDALFPMVLGVLDISTAAYSPALDPFSRCYGQR